MQEFEKVKVTHGSSIELIIDNPTDMKLIGKGAHGAVFRLSKDKCVKIYADIGNAKMETDAYKLSQKSDAVPRLYETGSNYIVIEYIEGTSLLEFLSHKNRIPFTISCRLINLFKEMQRIGFTRIDSSLRHIIIASDGYFKVVDLVYSYIICEAIPKRALIDLNSLSLLIPFLKHLELIDRELYEIWQSKIPKFTD